MDLRDEIQLCVDIIKNGGVVAFPTDTVWGFICSPFNQEAVDKIVKLKGGRDGKFFVLNAGSVKTVKTYSDFTKLEKNFMEKWPAPFTMILKSKPEFIDEFAAGVLNPENKFSIRVPNFPFLLTLLIELGLPVISTSVNLAGEKPCVDRDEVVALFGGNPLLSHISSIYNLKADAAPSTLLEVLSSGKVEIYRQGAFQVDEQ